MGRAKRSEGADVRARPRRVSRAGVLYVVATPIGNLDDFSPRARRTLRSVSLIAAEDTRRLRALAGPGGFRARLLSIPAPREAERTTAIVAHLASGMSAALVTDAGTPVVSDPGGQIIRAVREAGFEVIPIPGPSAVATALAGAGLGGAGFLFLGFLPTRGSPRRSALTEIARSVRTVVVFEAPHRLARTLDDLRRACGDERQAVIARELTKVHEEIRSGSLGSLATELPSHVRGEITVVIEGRPTSPPMDSGSRPAISLDQLLDELLREGLSPSHAAREACRRLGCDRRTAYRAALAAHVPMDLDQADDQ